MGKTYVRCEKCGSEFRSMEWREGLKCPGCQSDQLIPVEYEDEVEGAAPAAPAVGAPSSRDSEDEAPTAWQRSPIVGALAVAIILFGVVKLWSWGRGPGVVTYTDPYQCSKCGRLEEISMDQGVRPPIECPGCGTETLCRQYKCGKCSHLFAWEAPKHPGDLDEEKLPEDEAEREKVIEEHNKKLEAAESFFMKCPKCESENVYEQWTESHKEAIRRHGKDLPDVTKKSLNEKYGIEF
jgi:DNA-directed RNA polymerase subunit RPC12/RpoP